MRTLFRANPADPYAPSPPRTVDTGMFLWDRAPSGSDSSPGTVALWCPDRAPQRPERLLPPRQCWLSRDGRPEALQPGVMAGPPTHPSAGLAVWGLPQPAPFLLPSHFLSPLSFKEIKRGPAISKTLEIPQLCRHPFEIPSPWWDVSAPWGRD